MFDSLQSFFTDYVRALLLLLANYYHQLLLGRKKWLLYMLVHPCAQYKNEPTLKMQTDAQFRL